MERTDMMDGQQAVDAELPTRNPYFLTQKYLPKGPVEVPTL